MTPTAGPGGPPSTVWLFVLPTGSQDSSLVTVPDSWLKGCEFESRQEQRKKFLLKSQLCVLTLIGVCSNKSWQLIPHQCFFFFKWRLTCANWFHSLGQDQSTVAQPAEKIVTECSLTRCIWARFLTDSHTLPGQRHSQPTPTSMGQRCMRV